jgi:hypothetical protein
LTKIRYSSLPNNITGEIMKRYEISSFLNGAAELDRLAAGVRQSFLSGEPGAPCVTYSTIPDDPTGFAIHVLHLNGVARLEYAKYASTTPHMLSAQYVFYMKTSIGEERLHPKLRMVAPNHLILPNNDVLDVAHADAVGIQGRGLNESISYSLLEVVVSNMEEWTYQK